MKSTQIQPEKVPAGSYQSIRRNDDDHVDADVGVDVDIDYEAIIAVTAITKMMPVLNQC